MADRLPFVNQCSSPEEKIALFRSLFRGRDDVYPRRFESRKTGKSGYAPACANEWVPGICEKPRIKCAECPIAGLCQSPMMSSGGTSPAAIRRGSRSSPACIRCSWTKRDDGKRDVRVYDYVDLNVPMLACMFDKRCRGYEAIGYTIVVPAGAIPGWPADVPLPSDPIWKRDYAASVHRLVRDGVDVPLAELFVAATRPIPHDAEGVDRARSASEAFLYRRLETLADTRSRFRLNADLPIPFDGSGRMEVDLLCADARVVIEVDGALHLADPAAYRRDRRKDQLLQENGYLVVRFLAEDLGKQLDAVLDSILRSLASRRSGRALQPLHVVRSR